MWACLMRTPGSGVRGGFKKIDRIFQNKLESIVLELNEYLYDDGGRIA